MTERLGIGLLFISLLFFLPVNAQQHGEEELLVSEAQSGAPPSGPTADSNPLVWYNITGELSGQSGGTAITGFTDIGSLGEDMITISPTDPIVRVEGDGQRSAEFNGTSTYMRTVTLNAALEFDPSTDSFSILVVIGDKGIVSGGRFPLHKGSTSSSITGVQYGVRTWTADVRGNSGGVETTDTAFTAGDTSKVFILTSSPGTNNGAIRVDDGTPNTITPGIFTQNWNLRLGSRSASTDGSGSNYYDGSLRQVAIWDRVLTAQEITDITNEWKVN